MKYLKTELFMCVGTKWWCAIIIYNYLLNILCVKTSLIKLIWILLSAPYKWSIWVSWQRFQYEVIIIMFYKNVLSLPLKFEIDQITTVLT